MKIGVVFDLKEDFSFANEAVEYLDFCYLSEATSAKKHLELSGHTVELIGGAKNLARNIFEIKNKFNLIYNIAEGFKSRNREGLVPAVCELYKIPYTGSDAFGLSLSLHKYQTKLFASSLGVPVPDGYLYNKTSIDLSKLTYPIVTKPDHEGSSMGLQLCHSKEELVAYFHNYGTKYTQDILVEEYISGHELSVCILGSDQDAYVFCVVQYLDDQGYDIILLTNEIKKQERYNMIIPKISDSVVEMMKEYSLAIHRAMGLHDISRMDWRMSVDGFPYFLEATPLPILCEGTEFEWGCLQRGIPFQFIYQSVVNSAVQRYNL